MRRRLLILLIIACVAALAFVISGCSQLSSKESTVEKKFSALIPELSIRYEKLASAITLAETVGGKRDVVTDAKKPLKDFSSAKKRKDVGAELKAARDLETIIGRLRANATSSAKLSSSTELAAAIAEIDASLPGTILREAYTKSTQSYEDERTSWRYLFSSLVGGYSSPQQLEFSLPDTTNEK